MVPDWLVRDRVTDMFMSRFDTMWITFLKACRQSYGVHENVFSEDLILLTEPFETYRHRLFSWLFDQCLLRLDTSHSTMFIKSLCISNEFKVRRKTFMKFYIIRSKLKDVLKWTFDRSFVYECICRFVYSCFENCTLFVPFQSKTYNVMYNNEVHRFPLSLFFLDVVDYYPNSYLYCTASFQMYDPSRDVELFSKVRIHIEWKNHLHLMLKTIIIPELAFIIVDFLNFYSEKEFDRLRETGDAELI